MNITTSISITRTPSCLELSDLSPHDSHCRFLSSSSEPTWRSFQIKNIILISADGEEELSCRCRPLSLDFTKEHIAGFFHLWRLCLRLSRCCCCWRDQEQKITRYCRVWAWSGVYRHNCQVNWQVGLPLLMESHLFPVLCRIPFLLIFWSIRKHRMEDR